MEYRYYINQFLWNTVENSFYASAPYLHCFKQDGSMHPDAFPNQKGQFFIDNPKTGGFRRFRFVKETINWLVDETSTPHHTYEMIDWIFESEDGIKCSIAIN